MAQERDGRTLPEAVREQLSRWGFILEQDKLLPNVASAVAGGPITGSWWASPASHGIYEALGALEEMPDVLRVKLVSGKVTFVLERLWPAVLTVAQSHDAWQLEGLTEAEVALLTLVEDSGSVRLDQLPAAKSLRDPARALERRLLVYGDELHTATGAHTKVLESWQSWLAAGRPVMGAVPLEDARHSLEDTVALVNAEYGAKATLPWQAPRSRS
jgi:hypothetical protein